MDVKRILTLKQKQRIINVYEKTGYSAVTLNRKKMVPHSLEVINRTLDEYYDNNPRRKKKKVYHLTETHYTIIKKNKLKDAPNFYTNIKNYNKFVITT